MRELVPSGYEALRDEVVGVITVGKVRALRVQYGTLHRYRGYRSTPVRSLSFLVVW